MKPIRRRSFVKKTAMAGALFAMPGIRSFSNTLDRVNEKPRKIYVFSKHLQWLGYEDMAKTAADIGFDGVDITTRPGGHVLPENVERDLPKAVDAVRKQGLTADTITTAITGTGSANAEKILQTASGLGIRQYRMGWLKYDDALTIPQNLENIRKRFSELAQMNEHYGIRGDYQNHAGTFFGSPVWDLWQILKELDTPWLGCRYDIRHATVEGNTSWPLGMKAIAPYIKSLDIKDFTWRPGDKNTIVNVPLGQGVVDFKRYMELLKEYNVQGNFTLHFEYPMGGAEHGGNTISASPEQITKTMRRDLTTLRSYLAR